MARADNQLDRSLAALTLGVQSGQKRRAASQREASGEYDQQVQVPVTGQAALAWTSVDKGVNFRLPFLNAQSQRAVPFSTPHFTQGLVFLRPPAKIVRVTADVVQWSVTSRGWVTGAMMRYAIQCPEAAADELVSFAAMVHLNFQGYAAHTDTSEEL